MIAAKNISKRFRVYNRPRHWLFEKLDGKPRSREVVALSDVSLAVGKGECLGVIGGNGAGKSTLLKILAGISPPSAGELSVSGRVSAILELDSGFHPEFTGRENIRIGASVLGLTRAQTAAREDEIIAFSGLSEFIDLPVRTYSTGMYLRLGFSLATAVEPEVLLVDEALAVGDEGFRAKCVDRIRQIRQTGAATVIVSHDLTLVRALCDRAILIHKGRVEAEGKPLDVINHYLERIYEAAAQEAGSAAFPSDRPRRGSGEVQITAVRMIGPDGRPSTVFKTGDPITIEFDYTAHHEIQTPLFGINIFRADGVLAVCTNSEASFFSNKKYFPAAPPGDNPEKIPAGQKATARFVIEHNPLLSGSYELSVNVYRGPSGAHAAIDEILGAIPFKIHSPDHPDLGLILCPGTWTIK
ncbi:MAG TPA: ABC transporter ATP-binding protein [bacterium]|nr:ABC transporter ATP-binding protein [bacterium]